MPLCDAAQSDRPSGRELIVHDDAQTGRSRDHRLLWIDDQINVGNPALRLLALEGFEVECAETGSEGLRKAVTGSHSGIILDLRLPDMPGLAVLQRLKSTTLAARVLVVTGFAEPESAVAAMKLGAVDYKTKPLIGDDLLWAVRMLISAGSQRSESDRADCDLRRSRSVLTLDETARRLAVPTVGVLEFVLLTRSFRHLVGGSNICRHSETSRISWTPRQTALVTSLLAQIEQALSSGALPSIDDIAQETSIPAAYINSLLKNFTSSDFRVCRRTLRVRPTIPEIAWSHEQMAQIAYRRGYEWPGQLDRDFKATLLLTPHAFRRLFLRNDRSP